MKYTVEVTSKVTLEVEAQNDQEAIEKAGGTAWTYDPDEQDIEIVQKEASE